MLVIPGYIQGIARTKHTLGRCSVCVSFPCVFVFLEGNAAVIGETNIQHPIRGRVFFIFICFSYAVYLAKRGFPHCSCKMDVPDTCSGFLETVGLREREHKGLASVSARGAHYWHTVAVKWMPNTGSAFWRRLACERERESRRGLRPF